MEIKEMESAVYHNIAVIASLLLVERENVKRKECKTLVPKHSLDHWSTRRRDR